jgi:hypothetical protein
MAESIRQAPLEWGETPWDRMSREELVRSAAKLYIALLSARTVLRFGKIADEERSGGTLSPFWKNSGLGGETLRHAEEATEIAGFEAEDIYRAFSRYGADLLFEDGGFGWRVCPAGHMLGRSPDGPTTVCTLCGAETRPIVWADLSRPRADAEEG